ncbi:MAG: hypothetical protein RLO17_13345 [Cyclobacteriaceae bacterium]
MKRYIFLFSLTLFMSSIIKGQVKTLKDSLLEKYTMEELKNMSTSDFGNAVRRIRGLEPLILQKEQDYDFYGVKIIKDIPEDSIEVIIDNRVAKINNEKENYRQEVFPNAWRDVIDGFGLHFYNDIMDRVKSDDEKVILELINDWVRVTENSPFSDFAQRIYYFNESGSLRLITREMGYNLSSGKSEEWEAQMEMVYYLEKRYVWNDTLQFSSVIKCKQYVPGYPDYTTQMAIDTTLTNCTAWQTYHYKNNCFNLNKKEGEYPRSSWRKEFEQQPFEIYGDCDNGAYISLRNLIEEREEYFAKKNEHLYPVPTSKWTPYMIEGKWKK